jgi:hypothetical protein
MDWLTFADVYETWQQPVCWRCAHVLTIDEYEYGDYCYHCLECTGCYYCVY